MSLASPQLLLLSTEGCHLCEYAKEALDAINVNYQKIDIVESEDLMVAYSDHIPVLIAEGAEQALFWPFTEEDINQYKEFYGIS